VVSVSASAFAGAPGDQGVVAVVGVGLPPSGALLVR